MLSSRTIGSMLLGIAALTASTTAEPLRVGTFDVDASPRLGTAMAYNPTKAVQLPLSCRGIVLIGEGGPVVLCAVDWIGISNDSQKAFREGLAKAAGTTPDRVAIHTLHQHDAPRSDLSSERMLAEYGIEKELFDPELTPSVIARAAEALKQATANARPVTQIGLGQAEVREVASNRRIMGPNGKVRATRYTACTDPKLRAEPEGTIDPLLRLITLWDGETPVAALSYYATHPQSYYLTGLANPDFPGMARDARQKTTGVPHIHFDGAGGNIGAGKYNDGAHENRQILADRVADGMARAWNNTKKTPITAADLDWKVVPVALPPATNLDESKLRATLEDQTARPLARGNAAHNLIWLKRCRDGDTLDVGRLRLGPARVLYMPGELFVEYQLAAQALRPDDFIAMAAYGDYSPGYIGTEASYPEGGYETSPGVSLVAPSVEHVLMDAIRTLLRD